ncbi:MAG: twin-arginine translocation signal domain-containing protein, partial [Myxococcales bacterium]
MPTASREVRGRGFALVSGIVRPRLATAGPEKREEGGSTNMATKHTQLTRRDVMKYSGAAGA